MRYRALGRTGLKVSILGYGASPLGGVFGTVDTQEARRSVHAALDAGINFIDCSPYYGGTTAESVLGECLRGVSRGRYMVATKVGRYGDAEFDFSATRVTASIDESLARLEIDEIDLIQCHDIEFGSLEQIVEETLPALRKAQAAGKVRYVGVTGLPLAVFYTVLDRTDLDTVLSYCHYNLYDNSLERLLPYLVRKRVGVINASPLGMGLLTENGLPDWHPAPPELKQVCAEAAEYCRRKDEDISSVGLTFAISNPKICTTLVGMATEELVQKNVACVDREISPDLMIALAEIFRPVHDLSWSTGRPENSIPR